MNLKITTQLPQAGEPGVKRGRGCRVEARRRVAFTLLEVMIAIGIFFMAAFAILGVVSNSLANARSLERPQVDAGPVLAYLVSTIGTTNQPQMGIYSGNLSDILGKDYQGYTYVADVEHFWDTNNLLTVDCEVRAKYGSHKVISHMFTCVYNPNASRPPGPFDRSMGIRRGRR